MQIPRKKTCVKFDRIAIFVKKERNFLSLSYLRITQKVTGVGINGSYILSK